MSDVARTGIMQCSMVDNDIVLDSFVHHGSQPQLSFGHHHSNGIVNVGVESYISLFFYRQCHSVGWCTWCCARDCFGCV